MKRLLARAVHRLRPSQPPRDFYPQLAELASRYRDGIGAAGDLTQSEYRVFSQNGEDGVICELLSRVGSSDPFFVEFGAETGIQGNCVFLAEVLGWNGLWIEASEKADSLADRWIDRPGVVVARSMVAPENVNRLFREHGVPDEPDLVSIDIDGNDYYVWEALEARPALLVIEYNSSLPTDRETRLVQEYSEEPWDGTDYFGASLGALEALGESKGYRLVYTDVTGVNSFFVRDDLDDVESLFGQSPRRRANYYFTGHGWAPDPRRRRYRRV